MPKAWLSSMLKDGLYTQIIGRRILHFEQITSTMDEASALAEKGAEDGTVVLAEEQSAGRGRFSRPWLSPKGNLSLSVLLRPERRMADFVSMLAGLAVVRSVRKTTGLEAYLKWPNDVLLRGRKLSGILVETSYSSNELQYVVVGIGINLSFDPSMAPELSDTAAGLDLEAGRPIEQGEMLRNLLQEMDALYLDLKGSDQQSPDVASGSLRILDEYRSCLSTLGQQVEVTWKNDTYRGYADDVDETGNLILRLDTGRTKTIFAGEVTSSRPLLPGVR